MQPRENVRENEETRLFIAAGRGWAHGAFACNSCAELPCQPLVTGDGISDDLLAEESNRTARVEICVGPNYLAICGIPRWDV